MRQLFFSFILLFAVFSVITPALARIDIVPHKILIESRERGGELTILNLSTETATYRMSLVNFQQDENGIYKELETPLDAAFNPEEIVRFSPKQFTLPPRGKQKIRISLRKPANLPEGEYRFHVKALQYRSPESLQKPEGDKSVSLMMNTGVTIPVVVRHGKTSVGAKLGIPTIVPASQTKTQKPELHMVVARLGNASALGSLQVIWEPANGTAERIGRITNLNVFKEIEQRHIKLPLTMAPTGSGSLRVRFIDEFGQIFDEVVTTQ